MLTVRSLLPELQKLAVPLVETTGSARSVLIFYDLFLKFNMALFRECLSLVTQKSKMKISLDLNDEVAERLLAMYELKRSFMLKLITDVEVQMNWKDIFIRTAENAANLGLTEEKLQELLKK
jgi:hypothetical protein